MNPNYGLSDYLMFEEKNIKALRKRNKLNQEISNFFCNRYDDNSVNYWMTEAVLNEAYRLCAKALLADDPCDDVMLDYINESKLMLHIYRVPELYRHSLCIMHLLLTEYCKQCKEIGNTDCSLIEELCGELWKRFNRKEYVDWLVWWRSPACLETIDQTAAKMDIIKLLQITPTEPSKLLNIVSDIGFIKQVAIVTEDYDQDVIREIISRYPTKEQQLGMLNIIRNVAYGKKANGEDDSDLPF